ncbi:HEPN domain-containing protein [Leptospira licerasiae]|uniref:ApeA N-terminal domain 1-containing protein n=1 Tax=Leptospira licerasiae TaxID=447106 RepID=UPI00301A132D
MQIKAYFWKSNEPENRFAGLLRFSPKSPISVDLIDILKIPHTERDPFSSSSFGTFFGETQDGKKLSVFDCYSSESYIRSKYQDHLGLFASAAVIGLHCESLDDITLDTIRFTLSLGLSFVGYNPFRMKLNNSGYLLRFKRQSPIESKLSNDLLFKSYQLEDTPYYFQVRQKYELSLQQIFEFSANYSIKYTGECQQALSKIVLLNEIAALAKCSLLKINGWWENTEIIILNRDINFDANDNVPGYEYFFTLSDIVEALPQIWITWETSPGVLQFVEAFRKTIFLNEFEFHQRFLILVQAMEALDRARFGGNESLGQRIERLLKEVNLYKSYFLSNQENFIRDVVNTRNYLVHGNPKDKINAKSEHELYRLANYMEIFAQILSYKLSKMPDEVVRSTVIRRRDRQLMSGGY